MRCKMWLAALVMFGVLSMEFVASGQEKAPPKVSKAKELSVQLPTAEQESPAAKFRIVVSPATAQPGDEVTLTVNAEIAKDWHINSVSAKGEFGFPTKIELKTTSLEPIDENFTPSVKPKELPVAGASQLCHSGSFAWTRKYRVGASGIRSVRGSIEFQACDDQKCLPPKELEFSLRAKRTRAKVVTSVTPEHKTVGKPVVIGLEACKMNRPKAKLSLVGVLFGSRTEALALTGKLNHKGKEVSIYLPRKRSYTLENTAVGGTRFENTSTYLSIDHDGDGEISDWETVASNRPFRIADSMYQVTNVDKAAAKISVQEVSAPLSGSLVGQKVPPFKLTTVDGKEITDKSILGKVTLLDVWAVT